MTRRIFLAAAVMCLFAARGGPASAYETPEAAIQALIAGNLSKETFEAAKRDVEAAAAREPSNNRWQFGKVLVLHRSGESLEARDLMAKVVEREPKSADYQFWFGSTVFDAIDETGMLMKMSWGMKGKAALEKAIELDPNHVMAHVALTEFYREAPAIAGGSTAKAEAHAQALLGIPEGRGEFMGRMELASLAAEKKDWAEMSKQFTLAETAKGERASPTAAMASQVSVLLQQANDPAKALPVAERLAKQAKPDEATAFYLLGETQRKLGDCKSAIAQFEKVLTKRPEAQNSRYGAASCYEKLGDGGKAATNYEEFARRFPKDDRASEATAAAKRLRKAG